MSREDIVGVFTHICLPHRLPSAREENFARINRQILDRTVSTVERLRSLSDTDSHARNVWTGLLTTLRTTKQVVEEEGLNQSSLEDAFAHLQPGSGLFLHVTAQNAGLLVERRCSGDDDDVYFQAFEVSASSESVLATRKALPRQFPGVTASMKWTTFHTQDFHKELAKLLKQASEQFASRFVAKTMKAGVETAESRDTASPALITDIVLGIVEVLGKRTVTTKLAKQVRDDVLWEPGAKLPWRRSGFWLILRVGLQLHLCQALGHEEGFARYKFFMCLLLAELLDDLRRVASQDDTLLLQAKLGRRLSKIECDKSHASDEVRQIYTSLSNALEPIWESSLRNASEQIESVVESLRRKERRVFPLHLRARPEDQILALTHSIHYLQKVLQPLGDPTAVSGSNDTSQATKKGYHKLANKIRKAFAEEQRLQQKLTAVEGIDEACDDLSASITNYLLLVGNQYDNDSEMTSELLLTVMELWVALDKAITAEFPLLQEFAPAFPATIVDTLCLPRLDQMTRVTAVSTYLTQRHEQSVSSLTVFAEPQPGCFAEKWFDELPAADEIHRLQSTLAAENDRLEEAKHTEWKTKVAEYAEAQQQEASLTCTNIETKVPLDKSFPVSEGGPFELKHIQETCPKCKARKTWRYMKLAIHERILPSNAAQRKALLVEMRMPRAIVIYRDVTWKLVIDLATENTMGSQLPSLISSWRTEFTTPRSPYVTLGSRTKPFGKSHYFLSDFTAIGKFSDACKPNGMRLQYCTRDRAPINFEKLELNFNRLLRLILPSNTPLASLQFSPELKMGTEGPTSNQAIAMQTKTPAGISVREYTAFVSLPSGQNLRWLSVLIELGSADLNFSTEATSLLVSRLAHQVGPVNGEDPLRICHRIFTDGSFCERLLQQLSDRVHHIANNWRETTALGLLTNLAMRLFSLTTVSEMQQRALQLLKRIRDIALKWVSLLREEKVKATDIAMAATTQRYGYAAALVCRQTYECYIGNRLEIDPQAAKTFIIASMALQENLPASIEKWPRVLRRSVLRDIKLGFEIRTKLQVALAQCPSIVVSAIAEAQPIFCNLASSLVLSSSLSSGQRGDWFELQTKDTAHTVGQTLLLNWIDGHFLVNGQQIGNLPSEHRAHPILNELFEDRILRIYPPTMSGMCYTLAAKEEGHEVHIGFRNGQLIVRTRKDQQIHELIPRDVFGDGDSFDLPASMVDDCTHWMDIGTHIIEIRRKPKPWFTRYGDWKLDLNQRKALRRESTLVDPGSLSAINIVNALQGFELRRHITVFQPKGAPLSAELKRLDLSFRVSNPYGFNNELVCEEHRAKVDSALDIGTWHGLQNKLVLQSLVDHNEIIILVSTGRISCRRIGRTMQVFVDPSGSSLHYTLNRSLGQVVCAAEPRALYTKAVLHAYTSSAIPDALTGKTGVEEALHFLRSGQCEPVKPLQKFAFTILEQLAALTPKRFWYPDTLKVLQRPSWDNSKADSVQHEAFLGAVSRICEKSDCISRFYSEQGQIEPMSHEGDLHLLQRALSRRLKLQRLDSGPPSVNATKSTDRSMTPDAQYKSRDLGSGSTARNNMKESLQALVSWPQRLSVVKELGALLGNTEAVLGFQEPFSPALLNEALSADAIQTLGPLIQRCRISNHANRIQLLFLFALLSFREDANPALFRTLAAFAIFDDLKVPIPPKGNAFCGFEYRANPTVASLAEVITSFQEPFVYTSGDLKYLPARRAAEAARRDHDRAVNDEATALAKHVLKSWPSSKIDAASAETISLIKVPEALKALQPELERYVQNLQLSEYFDKVAEALKGHHDTEFVPVLLKLPSPAPQYPERKRGEELVELSDLMKNAATLFETSEPTIPPGFQAARRLVSGSRASGLGRRWIERLKACVNRLNTYSSSMRVQYKRDLLKSIEAFEQQTQVDIDPCSFTDMQKLDEYIIRAEREANLRKKSIVAAMMFGDRRLIWLKESGMLPPMTTISLLEQLQSIRHTEFGPGMREALTGFGVALTTWQRLMRIKAAYMKQNRQSFLDEVSNEGYENWDPLQYPDWLLIQLDGNFLFRKIQISVALATIKPHSGTNSLLQLQMGQGKSSCIVPAASAVLADGQRLLRVIIPRSLLTQTAQTMQLRLGGLVGRKVLHLPFSRRTDTDTKSIQEYRQLHIETIRAGGVVLTLPEHIMSFKLSGHQKLSDSQATKDEKAAAKKLAEAVALVDMQKWLQANARDILDESDFILGTRTQLIYPGGSEKTVDGSPQRWEVVQTLLQLIMGHLGNLKRDFPESIVVVNKERGGFPRIHFLRKDVEDDLIRRAVTDVAMGKVSSLPLMQRTDAEQDAVCRYISSPMISKDVHDQVGSIFQDDPAACQTVYLLRGLLVHRLLLATLRKRWNVHYGMHPQKPGLSVPFHAKGVPSDTAEWGHPDVAILLTCLSLYYGGLSPHELAKSFREIAKRDDPAREYDRWTESVPDLPENLKDWNGINLEDSVQMSTLYEYLRHSPVAADHYLNAFVFPIYATQFAEKLQCSAWDIPLFSAELKSEDSSHKPITTGFSGTTDEKYLFPLNIRQETLPDLAHTGAEVLSYVVDERRDHNNIQRNGIYRFMSDPKTGGHISESKLLWRLANPRYAHERPIRVLIDAGAQIMELDNLSLVKEWLKHDRKAQGGVYFETDGRVWVYPREQSAKASPLSESSLADRLNECVIYFSQANCRGADIRLPADAHAAVTLSQGLTKDAAMQAIMRMRQFSTTQTFSWIATPEVDRSIRDHQRDNGYRGHIRSEDVVSWLLEQTCLQIEAITPLFHSQGKDFCTRQQAEINNPLATKNSDQRVALVKKLSQKERQTLEEIYAPRNIRKSKDTLNKLHPKLASYLTTLDNMKQSFEDRSGGAVHSTALEEVEVEKECEHQAQKEQTVQPPVHAIPLAFAGLHRDFKAFVRRGIFPIDSNAIMPILDVMNRTEPARKQGGISLDALSRKLFASTEFCRTVDMPAEQPRKQAHQQSPDNFMRQARYILWSSVSEIAVLICPEEAELLFKMLRFAECPKVFLLTYAAPITRRMMAFNSLQFLSIPAMPEGWQAPLWLKTELGLFSGKLFFDWDEYDHMRSWLGIRDPGRPEMTPNTIAKKPITFLQEFLNLRRKGQEFSNTPVGYLSQGKLLTSDHVFFGTDKAINTTGVHEDADGESPEEDGWTVDEASDTGLVDDGMIEKDDGREH